MKRFNANSISKVRKLVVAGLVSAALAGPLVWVGPDYNGMVFIYREQKMPSFVRCTIGFPLPLDTLSVKNIDLHFNSILSVHAECRMTAAALKSFLVSPIPVLGFV